MSRPRPEQPELAALSSAPVQVRPDVQRLRPGDRTDPPNRDCGFYLDPAAGTITWVSDSKRQPVLTMRLPGGVGPAHLPELRRVTTVTTVQSGLGVELLALTGPDGRCLATTGKGELRGFRRMWPDGRLDPLAGFGVAVDQDVVSNRKLLQRNYPGAARWWWLVTFPYAIAPYLLAVAAGLALVLFVAARL